MITFTLSKNRSLFTKFGQRPSPKLGIFKLVRICK
jgi:hypothetical protein